MDDQAPDPKTIPLGMDVVQPVVASQEKTTNKGLAAKVTALPRMGGVAHVLEVLAGWLRLSAILHWLAKIAEPVASFFEHRLFPGFGVVVRTTLDGLGWFAAKLGIRRGTIKF